MMNTIFQEQSFLNSPRSLQHAAGRATRKCTLELPDIYSVRGPEEKTPATLNNLFRLDDYLATAGDFLLDLKDG